jgi:hypothetical protein
MNTSDLLFTIDKKVNMTIHVQIDLSGSGKIMSYIINRTPDHFYRVTRCFTVRRIMGPDDMNSNDSNLKITDKIESIMTLKAARSLIIQQISSIGWENAVYDVDLWLGWNGNRKTPSVDRGTNLVYYRCYHEYDRGFGSNLRKEKQELTRKMERSVKRIFDIIDGTDMIGIVDLCEKDEKDEEYEDVIGEICNVIDRITFND